MVQAQCLPSIFATFDPVLVGHLKWIEENLGCSFEAHAVLADVRFGLGGISFEANGHADCYYKDVVTARGLCNLVRKREQPAEAFGDRLIARDGDSAPGQDDGERLPAIE